ncbi:MAG: TetR/AcrR family transcriptional regulator, partial [Polyangiaceae bacterium]|nr:TetR/AcrR family transcriptional regulator [Polyangiaceae bacterium]
KKEAAKSARKDLHRTLVIEAAERAFAEKGYDGTRMQDIANEAGLALATVYTTVPSKEDIFAAIHELRGRALLAHAAEAASSSRSAMEAILAGVESYVTFLAEHPSYLRIHLLESQPWALDPKFTCAEQRKQWREGLELSVMVFREGIRQGSVRPGDPELYARLMIAGHQVFLAHWVEGGMKAPRADLIREMKDFVARSFGT